MPTKLHDFLYHFDTQADLVRQVLEAAAPIEDNTVLARLRNANAILITLRNALTEDWEEVAVYYADCQAATASIHGYTKSMSAAETRRHMDICEGLLAALEHGVLVGKRPSEKNRVIRRLHEAIAECKKKLETKKSAKRAQPSLPE